MDSEAWLSLLILINDSLGLIGRAKRREVSSSLGDLLVILLSVEQVILALVELIIHVSMDISVACTHCFWCLIVMGLRCLWLR